MNIENSFNNGELRVQERVGVRAEGERSSGVISDSIMPGALRLIEQQDMIIIGSVDQDENVWAAVLAGQIEFMEATTEQRITFDFS